MSTVDFSTDFRISVSFFWSFFLGFLGFFLCLALFGTDCFDSIQSNIILTMPMIVSMTTAPQNAQNQYWYIDDQLRLVGFDDSRMLPRSRGHMALDPRAADLAQSYLRSLASSMTRPLKRMTKSPGS